MAFLPLATSAFGVRPSVTCVAVGLGTGAPAHVPPLEHAPVLWGELPKVNRSPLSRQKPRARPGSADCPSTSPRNAEELVSVTC